MAPRAARYCISVARMPMRCAVLDDYQSVATSVADWSSLEGVVEVVSFTDHISTGEELDG
jgi:hypothetical protein